MIPEEIKQKIKDLEDSNDIISNQIEEYQRSFQQHFHDGNNSIRINRVDILSNGQLNTPATTGTMSVPMNCHVLIITPDGDCTFNADKARGDIGSMVTFYITTSGVTSRTLTFGTNFKSAGTLATGTTSARFFTVSFVCVDGIIWAEIGRTTAMV